MSKDKNKNEGLIALDDALTVRMKVTERLKTLATQSQKKLEGLEEALAKAKTDEEIQKAKEALKRRTFRAMANQRGMSDSSGEGCGTDWKFADSKHNLADLHGRIHRAQGVYGQSNGEL